MSIRIIPYARGYALILDGTVSLYALSFAALAETARYLIHKEVKT